ncbi:hypothetical protein F4778DRAFT_62187 [Xylariomycetidae sp. FL2044]|nr:hypothetical protein F4778DRAFT_62187 [Xylariomycetidae sp. FL2044]
MSHPRYPDRVHHRQRAMVRFDDTESGTELEEWHQEQRYENSYSEQEENGYEEDQGRSDSGADEERPLFPLRRVYGRADAAEDDAEFDINNNLALDDIRKKVRIPKPPNGSSEFVHGKSVGASETVKKYRKEWVAAGHHQGYRVGLMKGRVERDEVYHDWLKYVENLVSIHDQALKKAEKVGKNQGRAEALREARSEGCCVMM